MVVLHITSAWDTTTDLVIRELDKSRIESVRVNTESFPTHAELLINYGRDAPLSGLFSTDSGRTVSLRDVDSIYYRRPERPSFEGFPLMTGGSREFCADESFAALSGFLRLAKCLWVNDPITTRAANIKPLQLRTASECGFRIPETLITNSAEQALNFTRRTSGGVIAKTIRSPKISRSDSRLAYSHIVTEPDNELLKALRLAPCIFQEYIRKDYELRVTIVGKRVFPVAIYSQETKGASTDWRKVNYKQVRHEEVRLPDDIVERCLNYVGFYGLLFAAIDLIKTPDGQYVFLECNPNGEWAWLEDAAGVPIAQAIAETLTIA